MDELISIVFLIALFGGIYDLFTGRIPNWLTFPAMGVGIGAQSYLFGIQGLQQALLGILLGFGLYFPFFASGAFGFKVFGAGDVKLLMAIGAWLGWRDCLAIGILAMPLASVYAVVDLARSGRFVAFFRALFQFFRSVFIKGLVIEWPKLDSQRTFSYGLALSIATGVVIYLKHIGQEIW